MCVNEDESKAFDDHAVIDSTDPSDQQQHEVEELGEAFLALHP